MLKNTDFKFIDCSYSKKSKLNFGVCRMRFGFIHAYFKPFPGT